jgi:hypothetical protein
VSRVIDFLHNYPDGAQPAWKKRNERSKPGSGPLFWSKQKAWDCDVHLDEFGDCSLQFPHTGMGTTLNLSLGQQRKPAFHLIQP